jgi:hypothetical protein
VLELILGGGDARPPSEITPQGLALDGIDLLRQPPDLERPRGALDRAAVGKLEPGEDAQQRRLADAVGADESDAASGPHGEVDFVEDDRRAVRLRDAPGRQHGPTVEG